MPPVAPHPEDLFAPGRRHLVLLAHHDDELPYAGTLLRMGPEVRIVWLTNSDGLAHLDGTPPEAYGEARFRESVDALGHVGIGLDRVEVLGHSEYELYDLFARMVRDGGGHGGGGATRDGGGRDGGAFRVPSRFLDMADEVERAGRPFEPDVIWTLAYQGGHPEHDLMHLYAARLARRLSAERGRPVPFYELPAYELGIVPLRFKPWRRAPVHTLRLDDDAMARKSRMLDSYPTQWRILGDFRRLITFYGRLSALRLRPFTFEDFGRTEQFAPVPPRPRLLPLEPPHLPPRLPGRRLPGHPDPLLEDPRSDREGTRARRLTVVVLAGSAPHRSPSSPSPAPGDAGARAAAAPCRKAMKSLSARWTGTRT